MLTILLLDLIHRKLVAPRLSRIYQKMAGGRDDPEILDISVS